MGVRYITDGDRAIVQRFASIFFLPTGDNVKITQKSSESKIDFRVNSSLPTGIDGHESIHAETGECEASVLSSTDQRNHDGRLPPRECIARVSPKASVCIQ